MTALATRAFVIWDYDEVMVFVPRTVVQAWEQGSAPDARHFLIEFAGFRERRGGFFLQWHGHIGHRIADRAGLPGNDLTNGN